MKLLIASILLTLTAASCQRASQAEETTTNPPPGEVRISRKQMSEAGIALAAVDDRPVGNALITTGRVSFSDSRVAHVFSPVTGRVTKLLASLGQHVGRGTPLATIDSPELGNAVSDLEKAEADLAAAQRDYDRQKELYEAHAAAQRDFEAAESAFRKAASERQRASRKVALLQASGKSQSYMLRAPIDGDVLARAVSPGSEVQGQYTGQTPAELFTVGNLDSVWVLADVFEVDLPRVRIGAPVTINVVSYPDHPFQGRVDWISGALDPQTRTAKVRATIDNAARLLKPEMYATVSIATETHDRLAIPRTAAVRLGDQIVAFVDRGAAGDGSERFERRVIGIDDAQANEYVPVVAGLRRGETVVSSGAIMLAGAEE